jgi:hypothetical protein
MPNIGIYPLNPLTDVGQFRLVYGDTQSVPLSPVVPGFQDYTFYSDDEITAYVAMGGDSVARAIGFAYMQAAGAAAMQSKSVADYDLKVDLTKRSEDLRETALMWFGRADDADDLTGANEYFNITDTGTDRDYWDSEWVEGFPYWPGLAG